MLAAGHEALKAAIPTAAVAWADERAHKVGGASGYLLLWLVMTPEVVLYEADRSRGQRGSLPSRLTRPPGWSFPALMADRSKPPEAPRTDNTFVPGERTAAMYRGPFAERIEQYLKTIYASDDDAGQRHDRALEELRRDAAEVVIALARAGSCCHLHDYPRRWALVYAASRLEQEAALPYFRELILAPIPPPGPRGGHGFSAAREETVLRTTAVDGVARLASGGSRRAMEVLHEALDIPSISIRRASVQAILAVQPEARSAVAARIPLALHHLLDVKRVDISEVPQIRAPTEHLRVEKPLVKATPPPIASERPGEPSKQRSPKTRAK